MNQGEPLETASKKAYARVSEVLATFFVSKKFKKIPDKIDDMRSDFRVIKQHVETEHQKGALSSQERAVELKETWEVIRKGYDAERKKSIIFRKKKEE